MPSIKTYTRKRKIFLPLLRRHSGPFNFAGAVQGVRRVMLKVRKIMKREILTYVVKMLVVTGFIALIPLSCSKDRGAGFMGQIRLRFEEGSIAAVSKAVREDIPDTNDFILQITGPDGATVYEGPYGMSPETVSVRPGTCNVSIRSSEFSVPAFSAPLYGDDRCVLVPDGGVVDVSLSCTQLNSGIRLKIAPDFLTECPEAVLFVRGDDGQLMYGYSEKRVAYFLPGNISVVLKNPDKEQVLMTRAVEQREILTVNIDVVSGNAGKQDSGITVEVDTSRIWSDEEYVIGAESAKGDSPENAMSVSQAKSCAGEKDVWVCGYIVGGDLTSSATGISFSPPFGSATNIALASRGSVTDKSSCMSVQLPSGDVRDALNLVSNPELLGTRVCLKGDITAAYFGLTGLKNVSEFVIEE